MKKLLIILFIVFLFTGNALPLEMVRQKNVATYIFFPLVDAAGDVVTGAGSPDSESDTFADGTAPNGFVDLTNEATEIGTDGWYYISMTQAEMNFDYIAVQIKSSNATTQHILIRTTVGDPANLATSDDGGTINVTGGAVDTVTTLTGHTAQTGDSYGRLGAPAGASVSADIAAIKAETAGIITDTAEIGAAGAGLTEAGGTGDHLTAIDLPNQTMDIVGNITGNLSGSVGSLTGHTAQTGDNYARLGAPAGASVSADIAAIKSDSAAILTDTAAFDTAAECKSLIFGWAMTDLAAGAPAFNADAATVLNYLYEAWRNKTITNGTNSEIEIYKDDGLTKLVESDIADDGTDFTRGEMGAPD